MKKISKLLIGTNNKGKYKEIRDLLPKHIKTHSTSEFKLKCHSAPTRGERARLGVRLPKSLTSIDTPPLTRGETMHVLAVKDGAHSIARTTNTDKHSLSQPAGPAQNRCSRVAIFGHHLTGQRPQHSPHLLRRPATNSTAVSNRSQ